MDTHSLEIQILLATLPETTLKAITANGSSLTKDTGEPLAQILGIGKGQVLGVGEFKFVDKSLIVEISPEVDLEALVVDPKALVCIISKYEKTNMISNLPGR